MKIGWIAARYAPEFEGGSERVVRGLARGLAERGHDVSIVCGTDLRGGGELVRERVDGLDVIRIPLAASEPFDLELARPRVETLVAQCLEDRDVVHLHHWSTLSQRLVRVLAPQRPVLVTLHDAFATCPRFFRSSPLGLACPPRGSFENCARCIEPEARPLTPAELEPRLARRAREFEAEIAAAALWIAPSRFHAERLLALADFEREKCRIVTPATLTLDPRVRQARRRQARPAPGDLGATAAKSALRLLHFGNLCAEKGTIDIVETMALLPEGFATLTLAGRALTPGFEARVERARGKAQVRILGPYDARGLEREAAVADLAVFPTRLEESYGLVLDEAHALGLPAWTSDRGALPERLL
ncbi:MAG TPA: glycosyltransferase, partial [Planctomycetota bacterium]|nr:glycosyltransferase [Planctomycetota bacterium]